MFKLVALVVALMANGETERMTLRNAQTFSTEQACMDYRDSDKGKAEIEHLSAGMKRIENMLDAKVTYELKCINDGKGDGSI